MSDDREDTLAEALAKAARPAPPSDIELDMLMFAVQAYGALVHMKAAIATNNETGRQTLLDETDQIFVKLSDTIDRMIANARRFKDS